MDEMPLHFYPGTGGAPALPLARFLPPVPAGMAATWLEDNIPHGSWLLDPLGSSPAISLEAARAGYRVFVACNNPILSFMIETLAAVPSSAGFQSVLAELATAKRGEERMEKHVLSLYLTECENCGEHTPAQAFLWRKGETHPYARIYHCQRCGESPSGERPVTKYDIDRLDAMGGDRLQRARALQRVLMKEDDHRADVEEALENYLARPLYVLFTLLNKIDGMGLSPERIRLLQALLISAFDAGNTLWPYPGGRARPRQLTVPPVFRENNLWAALEDCVVEWTQPGKGQKPVPVCHWPDLPNEATSQEGAICLFRGRIKSLIPLPDEVRPAAVLTVIPRPSQAFWTLSALWSGWLWGPEASLPMRNILERRRFDWNWHTSAIHSALAALGWNLPAETPFFGLLPELAPGFLSAVMVACQAAGFVLEGLAVRGDEELAQGKWRPSGPQATPMRETSTSRPTELTNASVIEQAARAAIQADLEERSEPAPYLIEYAAGMWAMLRAGAVQRNLSSIPGDLLARVQAILAHTFADRTFLKVYGGQAEEAGWWWLAAAQENSARAQNGAMVPIALNGGNLPLADQVEIEIVRFMQKQSQFFFNELDDALCRRFPGLLTPPRDMIQACLDSYGEIVPASSTTSPQPNRWQLRPNESTAARKADLQEMQAMLVRIGEKLGFHTIERGGGLVWEVHSTQENRQEQWSFYRMASSIASRFVLTRADANPQRSVLVLPGSRARLLSLKLRRDPRLAEAARGWRILKFRHLREMAARTDMTIELWESLLAKDPLTEEATQMQLFGD